MDRGFQNEHVFVTPTASGILKCVRVSVNIGKGVSRLWECLLETAEGLERSILIETKGPPATQSPDLPLTAYCPRTWSATEKIA
jgi:hypothetical protein